MFFLLHRTAEQRPETGTINARSSSEVRKLIADNGGHIVTAPGFDPEDNGDVMWMSLEGRPGNGNA